MYFAVCLYCYVGFRKKEYRNMQTEYLPKEWKSEA